MYSHGVDIEEIGRLAQAIRRWGDRFLCRIYTPRELAYCGNRVPKLAARFAAKEAVMKALGTGTRGVAWREIEVLPDERGRPLVYLYNRALARAQELGIESLSISLSHSRKYVIASVIGEVK